MPYLTPDRFRAMGFGMDLSEFEEDDLELRQIISRASALIDAYCSVPMIPNKHDFRGGSVTTEQHPWNLPDLTVGITSAYGSRRVYPLHKPINAVTAFEVKFTNTYGVVVDPNNLYVNHTEGWAEVVSMAAIISGVYPVGINFGLYTPVAEISYTYGWDIPVVGEYLDLTDAGVYRSQNCWWHTTTVPKVYVNDALQNSGYTVNYDEGTVTFATPQAAGAVVTVDYNHRLPTPIQEASAFVVAHLLGERDLQRKGMAGIGMMRVAEVELRRSGEGPRTAYNSVIDEIEPEIGALLAPYVYWTVR